MDISNWTECTKLNTPAEEAFRVLRTNIQFNGYDGKIKSLAVTSCNPGEGKTTTAVCLSISMAQSGMRVLYVDADLRKPTPVKPTEDGSSPGLSNYLSGYASLEDVICSTDIEGFYYIPRGVKPPNPAELVGLKQFAEFIDVVESRFDRVVIDTPALGSVIDGAVISAKTDGVLLVIEPHAVEYRKAQRVKEQLEKANTPILGVVLNKVRKNDYEGG